MNFTQNKKIQYPKPFQSEWMDDGSRTIDNGQSFGIAVCEKGFEVRRYSGLWNVSDLFGEMGYWPQNMVWTASAETLEELLTQLTKKTGLNRRVLLTPINRELDKIGIKTYFLDEKKDSVRIKKNGNLCAKWSAILGTHRIPGLPSPEMWQSCWATIKNKNVKPQDCCYNGLELDFHQRGWTVRLFSDADDWPELFDDFIWTAATYDGLFSAVDFYGTVLKELLPWTKDDFSKILIKDDLRWHNFITIS